MDHSTEDVIDGPYCMNSESMGTLVIISYLYLKIGNETNGSSVQFSIINDV